MNESLYPPEGVSLVRSSLEPGEALLELCDFATTKKTAKPNVSAALTNRYVHFFGFRNTKRNGLQIRGQSRLPLSKISAVGVSETIMHGYWTIPVVHLYFSFEGKGQNLFSRQIKEAMDFSNELKRLLDKTEVTQGMTSIADEIEKFSQLTEEGILTQEEMQRAKEMFLGKPSNQIDESIRLLRNLKDLQKQKVLSESEFNMKKWDVLSKRDFQ